MSEIAKVESLSEASGEPASMLALLQRASRDPNVDVAKLERLLAMKERMDAKMAEEAFNAAMNSAQSQTDRIKADANNNQTHSKYATYAALDRALRPIYTDCGFSLSFDTGDSPEGVVRVLCYVSHKAGHTRTYRADIPADGKGAKGGDVMTKTHAVGSGMSYGMRYLLKMIFNVAIGEDDDDGNRAGKPVDGAWEQSESIGWGRDKIEPIAMNAIEYRDMGDIQGAYDFIASKGLPHEAITALWTLFDSKFRSALKKCKPQ